MQRDTQDLGRRRSSVQERLQQREWQRQRQAWMTMMMTWTLELHGNVDAYDVHGHHSVVHVLQVRLELLHYWHWTCLE